MNVDVEFDTELFNKAYLPALLCKDRFLMLYGGAGSGKSEAAAQKLLLRSQKQHGHRFLLARKVAATIRNSQMSQIKEIVDRWDLSSLYDFNDYSIRNLVNDNTFICTGIDNPEKLKSISGISGIWVEELTELSHADFKQLGLRIRGKKPNYKQIMATFNPMDMEHWIRREYFPDGDASENLTRFELPSEPNQYAKRFCTTLRTTFRDNKFLDDDDRAEVLSYKGRDDNYYRIYAEGLWGSRSEGLIYSKWRIVDEMPDKLDYCCYGLDFGFSTSSTALVKIGIKDGEVYVHEMIYQTHLTNPEFINLLKVLMPNPIDRRFEIFADSADASRIKEIRNAGFNCIPANKDVEHGIGVVQSLNLNITGDSKNVQREIKVYTMVMGKDGKPTDKILKVLDHSMDAIRYGIYSAWMKYGTRVFGGKIQVLQTPKKARERRHREDDTAGY